MRTKLPDRRPSLTLPVVFMNASGGQTKLLVTFGFNADGHVVRSSVTILKPAATCMRPSQMLAYYSRGCSSTATHLTNWQRRCANRQVSSAPSPGRLLPYRRNDA
jgi:hypothetical protein